MGPASRNLVQLASKYGKHTVVMLLLARRPSLAMERNEDGYCSIHLAAAHGYEIVILEHLKFNRSLCIIRDNNGWTPLHWATTKGRTGVIQLILRESVENIQSLTFKGESCFHLAVQHSQSEAFRILVHWLEQLTCEHMKNLINTRDNEGFAVLHKVVLKNQYQILEALISSKRICRALQVNITDASGLTALDLFYQYSNEPDREIGELLNRVGASRARRPRPVLIPINDDDNINGRNIFLVQLLARFLRVINSDNSDRIPIEILGFLLQLVAAVLIYSLQAVNSPFVSNTEHLEGQRFHYNIGDLLRGYGEPAQCG
ncbi:ankyrin repeat-containing protein BDA1 [Jatropha curcas]|uniref:ankyrin repeat-containing protein BDA1 n=1 Tax=Jatropha curcas TaxID=180498 RepID=UPI0018946A80|nr:ankyrin repeat-containing protein BDA1 [Jatropha curcas]